MLSWKDYQKVVRIDWTLSPSLLSIGKERVLCAEFRLMVIVDGIPKEEATCRSPAVLTFTREELEGPSKRTITQGISGSLRKEALEKFALVEAGNTAVAETQPEPDREASQQMAAQMPTLSLGQQT